MSPLRLCRQGKRVQGYPLLRMVNSFFELICVPSPPITRSASAQYSPPSPHKRQAGQGLTSLRILAARDDSDLASSAAFISALLRLSSSSFARSMSALRIYFFEGSPLLPAPSSSLRLLLISARRVSILSFVGGMNGGNVESMNRRE